MVYACRSGSRTIYVTDDAINSYFSCVKLIFQCTGVHLENDNASSYDDGTSLSPSHLYSRVINHGSFTSAELLLVLTLALFWTFLRYTLTLGVFTKLVNYWRIPSSSSRKVPENLFKLGWYSTLFGVEAYLLLYPGHYDFFHRPMFLWQGYKPHSNVTGGVYFVYMCQLSFYIHMIYATLYMDEKRKDSFVMLIHHFVTISLLGFSYAFRYTNVGMVVLVLHDFSDVALEFTKLMAYFKDRKDSLSPLFNAFSTVGFVVFASSWVYLRLYLFTMKVLAAIAIGAHISAPAPYNPPPFWFFFTVQLWFLQALHFWWFYFIAIFFYKVATGQLDEVQDTREFEQREDGEDQSMSKTCGTVPLANGTISTENVDGVGQSHISNGATMILKHRHRPNGVIVTTANGYPGHKQHNGVELNGAASSTSNGVKQTNGLHHKHE